MSEQHQGEIIDVEPLRLPALLHPAVRERLDQAEFVQATMWIVDDLGESLCLETVQIPRALLDGSCREVLRRFWAILRETDDPDMLAWAKQEWRRINGDTVPWPELPPPRRTKRAAIIEPKQLPEGSAEQ